MQVIGRLSHGGGWSKTGLYVAAEGCSVEMGPQVVVRSRGRKEKRKVAWLGAIGG